MQRSHEDLIVAARGGEREALVTLIEDCETSIASGIRAGGITRADPEFADAQLEALTTICDRFASFDGRGHVCAWMRVVARNTAADQIHAELRQRRIRDRLAAGRVETVHLDDDYDDGPTVEQLAESIVASLPPKYREVVDAFYLERRSAEEIAAELFISVDTVYVRLHRARKAALEIARRAGRD